MDIIHTAILEKKALQVSYQSFNAKNGNDFIFHAWWLKEFKNRWFMVGLRGNQSEITTLALDRIQNIEITIKEKYNSNNTGISSDEYYKDVIGVSVSKTLRPQKIKIFITNQHAPYVETKPLHASQKVIERNKEGIVIEIIVQHNLELEREILGFGEGMQVLEPIKLKAILKVRVQKMMKLYE